MVRIFSHYVSPRQMGLFTLEAAAVAFAAGAGLHAAGAPLAASLAVPIACVLAAILGALYLADLYDLGLASEEASGARALVALGAAAAACGLGAFAAELTLPPGALLAAVGAAAGAVFLVRTAWQEARPVRRILILGTGARARELALAVARDASGEFEVAGFLDDAQWTSSAEPPLPLLLATSDGYEAMGDVVRRAGASLVVVAADERRGAMPLEALLRCRTSGTPVLDVATFSERALRRLPVHALHPSALTFQDGFTRGAVGELAKRALDVVASLTLLVLAAPLLVVVAALVKLDSPGPVFYGQERVGKGGRRYRVVKFRTMRHDAERGSGPVWARAGDSRVTRLGRFLRMCRIDEIPQVWCVLRGDMSFVGPRPERPFFVEQLKAQIPFYELREVVKPGITGWAQIRYAYGASVDDARAKLEYDLYYAKNGTLFLDLVVIFHTAKTVLFGRGAR